MIGGVAAWPHDVTAYVLWMWDALMSVLMLTGGGLLAGLLLVGAVLWIRYRGRNDTRTSGLGARASARRDSVVD